MSIKYQWNDWSTDRRKPKHSEKNLSHFHFVQHNFHMDCRGIKPGTLLDRPATNHRSIARLLHMFKMGSKLTVICCIYGLRSHSFSYLCYMCHKRKSHGRSYSFSADIYPVLYVQYLSRTVSLTSAVERSDAVGSGGAMPSPT